MWLFHYIVTVQVVGLYTFCGHHYGFLTEDTVIFLTYITFVPFLNSLALVCIFGFWILFLIGTSISGLASIFQSVLF